MNAPARYLHTPLPQPETARPEPATEGQRSAPALRILTCGSVDDGKSSLIGRLLWDATDLYDDQRAQLLGEAARAGGTAKPDFSRLLDGLAAEREQGITIDVAWRYFDTRTRRIIIIDSPGHEQYTRNMASGASHADLAILLVDARHGIKPQTRRHAAILDLMGVRQVVLAVNKMDLVSYDEARFRQIETDFTTLAGHFNFPSPHAIPVAAVYGGNVASRDANAPWYTGPPLLELIDTAKGRPSDTEGEFRMPVQLVLRDGGDFRGLAGTISSGNAQLGDMVVEAKSGRQARIDRIATFDGDVDRAEAGAAVVIGLDRDLDISRGAVLAGRSDVPTRSNNIDARLIWLSDEPLNRHRSYVMRTATDTTSIDSIAVEGRLDLETLQIDATSEIAANDIAVVRLSLGQAIAADLFSHHPETGSFLLVDQLTGATIAGGVITAAHDLYSGSAAPGGYVLSSETLWRGLCVDLGRSPQDLAEFARRRSEVLRILRDAGVVIDDNA